ncbi:MerR family DNA-binding protein [Fulvitalea axinellae]
MRIGQIAKETGVSRDTIRLYEKMGLLKNVSRPNEYNNYKEYGEGCVDRVKLILLMKGLGFTLNECGEVLEMLDAGTLDADSQKDLVRKKLEAIDRKITELTRARKTLSEVLGQACPQEKAEKARSQGIESKK